MIKARANATMFFGLSEYNIKMLKQGRPIHVDLKDLGIKTGSVVIFYGPTEEIMETQLFSMLAVNTESKSGG